METILLLSMGANKKNIWKAISFRLLEYRFQTAYQRCWCSGISTFVH